MDTATDTDTTAVTESMENTVSSEPMNNRRNRAYHEQ